MKLVQKDVPLRNGSETSPDVRIYSMQSDVFPPLPPTMTIFPLFSPGSASYREEKKGLKRRWWRRGSRGDGLHREEEEGRSVSGWGSREHFSF